MSLKLKILVSLCLTFLVLTCRAQGTAFTYQGRLDENGTMATGAFDLRFALYDALSGGTALGVVTNTGASISNGLFTVAVDFGSEVFHGGARWLEIGIRTNGSLADFTTISPRQSLTPVPTALLAQTAEWSGIANVPLVIGTNSVGSSGGPFDITVDGRRGLRIIPTTNAPNVIGGDPANDVWNGLVGATIAGGGSSVGEWAPNQVGANYGSIAGGKNNSVYAEYSTISGGVNNYVLQGALSAVVAGGGNNTVAANSGVISGGMLNVLQTNASLSVIGGGAFNSVKTNSLYAVIGGGYYGVIETNAGYSTIAGGRQNLAGKENATVGGGWRNEAIGLTATVAGGFENTASGQDSFVGAGNNNVASGGYSVVSGGRMNEATNIYAAASGGSLNVAGGSYSYIGGGYLNNAVGLLATIAGGQLNTNSGTSAAIGGGRQNQALGPYTTVAGGRQNLASAENAFVGGGFGNQATGLSTTVSGGYQNVASGTDSTVPGGNNNVAGGAFSFAAGRQAKATNSGAFVWADPIGVDFGSTGNNQFLVRASGGVGINTNSPTATLEVNGTAKIKGLLSPNGGIMLNDTNIIFRNDQYHGLGWYGGSKLFAGVNLDGPALFGCEGGALGSGCPTPKIALRWDNSGNVSVTNGALSFGTATRQMLNLSGNYYGIGVQNSTVYFRTGFGYAWYRDGTHSNTQNDPGGGTTLMTLNSSGLTVNGTFVSTSDRARKENFAPVSPREILDKVVELPISEWSYRESAGTRHIGPMAQDFHAAFNLGADDKHIAMVDADGIALAAIQGLNQLVRERDETIEKLEASNTDLRQRLADLEQLVATLADQVKRP